MTTAKADDVVVVAAAATNTTGVGDREQLQQQQQQQQQSKIVPTQQPATKALISKRQKQKQKIQTKNQWLVQHPKVQSMKVRERLAIKDAGLIIKSKSTEQQQPQQKNQSPHESNNHNNSIATTVNTQLPLLSPQHSFGRMLGGTDARKRHFAVRKLRVYLKARCALPSAKAGSSSSSTMQQSGRGLSEQDLLQLWKALWFTLYMADKKPVQDELSRQIAQLIWCVAGTPEEDDYAAEVYLQLMAQEEDDDDDDDVDAMEEISMNVNADDIDAGVGDDDHDSGDPDVTLEEIENTLEQGDSEDSSNSDSDVYEKEIKDDDEEGCYPKTDRHVQKETDEDNNNNNNAGDKFDQDLHCRGAHLASLFVRTFFETLRRDWDKLDKYRVDKFYTLVRFMMHEVYRYMALRQWNFGIIRLFNDAIFDEALSQRPNGLRYHLIDITMEELAKVSAAAPIPLTEATILDVLEPYFAMCQTGSDDDTVQYRVMDRIIDSFLERFSVVSDNALRMEKDEGKGVAPLEDEKKGDDDNDSLDTYILDQVHVGTIAEFLFSLASDPGTKNKYRKSLYDMHKKYLRRLKAVGRDVKLEDGEGEDIDDENQITGEILEQGEDVVASVTNNERSGETNECSVGKKRKSLDDRGGTSDRPEDEPSTNDGPDDELPTNDRPEDEPYNEKKKKKRRKKRRKERTEGVPVEIEAANSTADQETRMETDEEIVISLSEQQRAKREINTKKMKKNAIVSTNGTVAKNTPSPSGKKVQFGKINHSKSHIASMKALVSAIPPKTKDRTPERSILRNKGKHSPKTPLSKQGRKKAADYW